jgi:predicted MFS family arabinose efflux permease
MAVVTTVGPLGAVAGPGIGGLLIELAGWPWIFFVNVPVAVAVVVIARRQLPPGRGLQWPESALAGEVTLFGAAAVAVLLGFTLGASSGPYWLLLTALAIPLLSVWWRTTGSRPVRDLFRIPGIAGPHLALSTEMAAVLLVIFLAPFYLQRVLEVSVATAGLTVLALPAAMTLAAPASGLLADLWGARRTALVGSVLVIAGLALVAPLSPDWTPAALASRFAAIGAGAGLFAAANLTMAMSATPPDRLHTTGATTSLARQLGISLGPALGTAVWTLTGGTGGTGGLRLAVWVAVAMAAVSLLTLAVDRRHRKDQLDDRSGRRTEPVLDQPPR